MKLKDQILQECQSSDFEENNLNWEAVEALSDFLEGQGIINYSVTMRSHCDDDVWLQAEIYHEGIKKTIILEYDFPHHFDSFNHLAMVFASYETQARTLLKTIKF